MTSDCGEREADEAAIRGAGSDELRGEAGLVGSVGASLAFDGYGAVVGIDGAIFPFGTA